MPFCFFVLPYVFITEKKSKGATNRFGICRSIYFQFITMPKFETHLLHLSLQTKNNLSV